MSPVIHDRDIPKMELPWDRMDVSESSGQLVKGEKKSLHSQLGLTSKPGILRTGKIQGKLLSSLKAVTSNYSWGPLASRGESKLPSPMNMAPITYLSFIVYTSSSSRSEYAHIFPRGDDPQGAHVRKNGCFFLGSLLGV